jgi:hypothetical protein
VEGCVHRGRDTHAPQGAHPRRRRCTLWSVSAMHTCCCSGLVLLPCTAGLHKCPCTTLIPTAGAHTHGRRPAVPKYDAHGLKFALPSCGYRTGGWITLAGVNRGSASVTVPWRVPASARTACLNYRRPCDAFLSEYSLVFRHTLFAAMCATGS